MQKNWCKRTARTSYDAMETFDHVHVQLNTQQYLTVNILLRKIKSSTTKMFNIYDLFIYFLLNSFNLFFNIYQR